MDIKIIDKNYVSRKVGKRRVSCVIQYEYLSEGSINTATAWVGYYIYPAGKINVGESYQMKILNNRVVDFRPANTENYEVKGVAQ